MNKKSFKQDEVTPKKRFKMHKRKKQWIVLAVAFLSFLGGSGVVSVTCGGEVAYAEELPEADRVVVDGQKVPKLPAGVANVMNTSGLFEAPEFSVLALEPTVPDAQNSANVSADLGLGTNVVQLSPYAYRQIGVIWSKNKVSLNEPFEYTSYLFMGGEGKGFADGITFTFHNDRRAESGEAVYGGTQHSLGVYRAARDRELYVHNAAVLEFDTCPNANSIGSNDAPKGIGGNHVALNFTNRTTATDAIGGAQHYNNIPMVRDELVTNEWEKVTIKWEITDRDQDGNPIKWRMSWKYGSSEKAHKVDEHYDIDSVEELNEIFGFEEGNPNDKDRGVYFGFTGTTGTKQLNMVALTALPMNSVNVQYIDETTKADLNGQKLVKDYQEVLAQSAGEKNWSLNLTNKVTDRTFVKAEKVTEKLVDGHWVTDATLPLDPANDEDEDANTLTEAYSVKVDGYRTVIKLYYSDQPVKDAIKDAEERTEARYKEELGKIKNDPELSPSEKTETTAELDKVYEQAKKDIEAAETKKEVSDAEIAANDSLKKPLADAKALLKARQDAIAALGKAKDEAVAQVNAMDRVPGSTTRTELAKILNDYTKEINEAADDGDDVENPQTAIEKIKELQTKGTDALLEKVKDHAKAELKDYAEKEIDAKIDALYGVTSETPADAPEKIKAEAAKLLAGEEAKGALSTALENVEKATDSAGVASAVTTGKAAMDKYLNNLQAAEAKNRLEVAAAEAIAAIKADSDLSADDKKFYESEITIVKTQKQLALIGAADAEALNEIALSGVKEIGQLALDAKAQSVKNAIRKEEGLDADVGQVDEVLATEKAKIAAADVLTDAAVAEKVKEGKEALADVHTKRELPNAKKQAKDQLRKEAATLINGLNALPETGTPSKAEYLAEIETALEQIDEADSKDALTEKVESAKTAVANIARNAAIEALNQQAKLLTGNINKLSDSQLSPADKAAVTNNIEAARAKAVGELADAADLKVISQIQAEGMLAMKAAEVDGRIQALPNVTQTSQAAAKKDIEKALIAALGDVTSQETTETALKAQQTGEKNLEDLYKKYQNMATGSIEEAREREKQALEDEAKDAKEIVNNLPNATEEQGNGAKEAIDKAKEDAQKAIDDAKNTSDLNEAVEKGKVAIQKEVAKAQLDDRAEALKKEIAALPTVTDEEKAAGTPGLTAAEKDSAQKEIDKAKNKAKDAIDQQNDSLGIEKEKANGLLDMKAEKEKGEIASLPNLSASEKTAANKEIEAARDAAKETTEGNNVKESATTEAVDKARETGEAAMEAITTGKKDLSDKGLEETKIREKDELEKQAGNAKDIIKDLPNVTEEEKDTINKAIDDARDAAKDAIDEAANIGELNDASEKGKVAIQKEVAKAQLEDRAEALKKEIAALPPVTDEEKAAGTLGLTAAEKDSAQKEIDKAKNKAKDAIDQQTDSLGIEKEKANGLLDMKAEKEKGEIASLPNLSASEKTAANKEIEAARDAAKETTEGNNVKESATTEAVDKARETGEAAMEAITSGKKDLSGEGLEETKKREKDELEKQAGKAKDTINGLPTVKDEEKAAGTPGLTEKEKTDAIEKIDKAKEDAQKAIDNAKNVEDINRESEKGRNQIQQELDEVTGKNKDREALLNALKEANKAEIEREAASGETLIQTLPNLTDEQKQKWLDQLSQAADKANAKERALKAIDDAVTIDEVQKAKEAGLAEFNQILDQARQESALETLRQKALAALELKRENVEERIKQFTDEEIPADKKTAALAEIETRYPALEGALKSAEDAKTLQTALTDGKAALEQIIQDLMKDHLDAEKLAEEHAKAVEQAKDAAIQELIAERKQAIKDITTLNPEKVADFIQDLEDNFSDEKITTAFEDAKTETDIAKIQKEKQAEIQAVVDKANLQKEKERAQKALADKLAALETLIDNLKVTGDKGTAKKAIAAACEDAKKAIASETVDTLGKVQSEKEKGFDAMDKVLNNLAKNIQPTPAPVIPTPTPTPTPTPSTPVTPTPTTPTTPSLPGTSTNTKVTAVQLYRAYNPNNGEHLYTADQAEYQHVVSAGWQDEGLAWKAVSSGDAVYRLYNPNSGEHFYTLDVEEYEKVAAAGWRKEGLVFYSNVEKAVPVYRLFNPNAHDAGSHHFTTDAKERDALVALGWNDEGIAFYGME